MKLLQYIIALFRPKAAPIAAASTLYSDDEFLNAVMEQARKSPAAGQGDPGELRKPGALGALPKAA